MRIILLLCFLIVTTTVKAQLFGVIPLYHFKPGYYYDTTGKKFVGKIEKDASEKNTFTKQKYILFKTDSTDKVRVPLSEIKAFVIHRDSFTVARDTPAYYLVMLDNPIKIYLGTQRVTSYSAPGGSAASGPSVPLTSDMETYYYGTSPDSIKLLNRKNFIEVMTNVMADNTEFVEAIKKKTYRYGNIYVLIEKYKTSKKN